MKRLIFPGVVAVVLTSFGSLRSAEADGPPETLVCHVPPGVVVPAPNRGAVSAHLKRHKGDCLLREGKPPAPDPNLVGPKPQPGDRCSCDAT